jgi:DNA-binding NarL/FixJ family response regulator
MIRILVVDDHPVVREGLMSIMSNEPDFVVVGEAGTGDEALQQAERLRPDVVLLDIRMPGMTGVEACEQLVKRRSDLHVILLTSLPNDGVMVAGFDAGARGFVLKGSSTATLRQAVRTVADGGTFADPKVAAKLVALASKKRTAKGPYGLTLQEMRVLELLPRGLGNRAIGEEMGVSEETVKTHVRNAIRKLGAKDRVEAAAIALREGLA